MRRDSSQLQRAESLTDQVMARVNAARLAIADRGNPASPPHEDVLVSKSLRRVFRQLGVLYRRYRSQTGGRVAPGLRDAAGAFRADPSLASLVAVAAFLDERDLLS